jgi:hypothetical protein
MSLYIHFHMLVALCVSYDNKFEITDFGLRMELLTNLGGLCISNLETCESLVFDRYFCITKSNAFRVEWLASYSVPDFLATLFGLTLLSHQIGGFFGAWLGGVALAHNGSYNWMWYADIGLAMMAAFVNLPIREKHPKLA